MEASRALYSARTESEILAWAARDVGTLLDLSKRMAIEQVLKFEHEDKFQ